jgi:hypothetical protein
MLTGPPPKFHGTRDILVRVRRHLLHAFLDTLHQHKRIHGVEACTDQWMVQLLD